MATQVRQAIPAEATLLDYGDGHSNLVAARELLQQGLLAAWPYRDDPNVRAWMAAVIAAFPQPVTWAEEAAE